MLYHINSYTMLSSTSANIFYFLFCSVYNTVFYGLLNFSFDVCFLVSHVTSIRMLQG